MSQQGDIGQRGDEPGDPPHRRGRGRGDAGSPWVDDFPESRDPETLKVDGATVRGQARGLDPGEEQDAWRERVTRILVEQRAKFPELPQIDLIQDSRRASVPVVRGELLLRSDIKSDDALWTLLQRYGTPEDVAELDNRVVRLRSTLSTRRLNELARFVRDMGYEASVNHVTPLGPLLKGQGGPEQTTATLPFPSAVLTRQAWGRVTVAVVDTGIVRDVRDDNWVTGLTATDGSNADPLDAIPLDGLLDVGAGHGTFAAGVVQQVAPMATLLVLRAIQSDGIGDEVTVAVKIVEAVRTADSAAPLVINLSLGAETLDDQPLLAVEVALEIAHELHPDCLAVAAAGNSGSTRPCFPAASRDVVAVAALDADLQPTAWTNRGFWVDCAVVGEGILSTYVPGHESLLADSSPETWDAPDPWALWSGTSFAAPQVAAAVARRASEVGCTTREALGWLFAQSPRVPDVGRVLRLLRGTPVT